MTSASLPISTPAHLQPYDTLTVAGRPAVFLWWMWKGREYARVRYTDTAADERAVIHRMDINTPSALSIARVLATADVIGAVGRMEKMS